MPDSTQYYDSQRSGCSYDYDTRGWTCEPAYNALLFDRFPSAKYLPTVGFLVSLENGGGFGMPRELDASFAHLVTALDAAFSSWPEL